MTHGRHKPDILARTHAMGASNVGMQTCGPSAGSLTHPSHERRTRASRVQQARARPPLAKTMASRWGRPPPSLSAIGCICGDSFSFEAAALAAASALTLPAGARTWTLGHRGSERGQASIRVGKHHWGRADASVSIRWDSTVHSARVAPIGGISWGLQLQPRFEDN